MSLEAIDGFHTKTITFDTLDNLIEHVSKLLDDPINKDKKLSQILEELGLSDTMTLLDDRTEQLLDLYSYFSSPATPSAPFRSKIWYDTVIILSNMQPRLF